MVKPFPCIFDVAADLTERGVHGASGPGKLCTADSFLSFPFLSFPFRRQRSPYLSCSRLDLFALMFLPAWALVNI